MRDKTLDELNEYIRLGKLATDEVARRERELTVNAWRRHLLTKWINEGGSRTIYCVVTSIQNPDRGMAWIETKEFSLRLDPEAPRGEVRRVNGATNSESHYTWPGFGWRQIDDNTFNEAWATYLNNVHAYLEPEPVPHPPEPANIPRGRYQAYAPVNLREAVLQAEAQPPQAVQEIERNMVREVVAQIQAEQQANGGGGGGRPE